MSLRDPKHPSLFDLDLEAEAEDEDEEPLSSAPVLERTIIFASGANSAGDVRGFAAAGFAVGVSTTHFHDAGEREALALADSGMPFFIDNGAFEEFDKKTNGPKVDAKGRERLIGHEQWQERLACYDRMASAFGNKLYCVAPDLIKDQQRTLERLHCYRHEMRAIAAKGANVLASMHSGPLSGLAFYREVAKVLGFEPVPAFPMPAGTTDQEILDLIQALQPKRAHLLGIGVAKPRAAELLAKIAEIALDTQMSLDACRMGAIAGYMERKDGTKKPRKLNVAKSAEWDEAYSFGDYRDDSFGLHFDDTDDYADPSSYIKGKLRRAELASQWTAAWIVSDRITPEEALAFQADFMADPTEAFTLRTDEDLTDQADHWALLIDGLHQDLLGEIESYVESESNPGREARCIPLVCGQEPGGNRYPTAMAIAATRKITWSERMDHELAARAKRKVAASKKKRSSGLNQAEPIAEVA